MAVFCFDLYFIIVHRMWLCGRTEGFFISMFAATVTKVSSCSKSTDLKLIKKTKQNKELSLNILLGIQ